jgi:hypothetical protein
VFTPWLRPGQHGITLRIQVQCVKKFMTIKKQLISSLKVEVFNMGNQIATHVFYSKDM